MIKLYILTFVFFHPTPGGELMTRTITKQFKPPEACEAERKDATEWIKQQKDAPQGFAACVPLLVRPNS